ncbi:MAG: hypothetical protein ACRYG8_40750 [Janthinobacterium lividum]
MVTAPSTPFRIDVPQPVLDDLARRLAVFPHLHRPSRPVGKTA